ncbi:MAG: hypothetical protein ACP5N2_04180 [Candidatus Nanoarchaeia archaeon]
MPNQILIDWIRGYLKLGYTSQQLTEYLLKQGYKLEDINESIKYASQIDKATPQKTVLNKTSQTSIQTSKLNKEKPKVTTQDYTYAKDNFTHNVAANNSSVNKYAEYTNQSQNISIKTKKQKTKTIILIVLAFVIILAVVEYFLYVDQSTDNDSKPIYYNTSNDSNLQDEVVSNQNSSVQELIICETKECFTDKFAKCEKASINVNLLSELTYRYEIITKENGYCKVQSQYTQNPDTAWLNKDMICLYNNSLAFDDSIKDMTRCTGALAELFNAGQEITV